MIIFLLLLITTALGLLSNVIANWIAPSLDQRKWLTIIIFIILSILSVSIASHQEDQNDEETKTHPKKEVKPRDSEKPKRDTVRIIEKYSQERTEPNKIYEAGESHDKDGNLVLTDINGNRYKTFKFQNLIWLASNLKTDVGENYIYDNKPNNAIYLGRLYSLETASAACELLGKGWHMPSNKEFERLIMSNSGGFYTPFYDVTGGSRTPTGNPEKGYSNFNDNINNFNLVYGGSCTKDWLNGVKYSSLFEVATYFSIDAEDKAAYLYLFSKETKSVDRVSYDGGYKFLTSCRCVKQN